MKNEFLKLLFQKKTTIILAVLMIFLFGFARSLLFIVALLLLNIIVGFCVKPFKYFFAGIEIVTLITIITSLAYGAVAGIVVGCIALLTNLLVIARVTPRVLLFLPAMAFLAAIAPAFAAFGITAVGIGAAIAYDSVVLLSILFFGGNASKGMIYIFVNILFNVFLFSAIAPGLLEVMV